MAANPQPNGARLINALVAVAALAGAFLLGRTTGGDPSAGERGGDRQAAAGQGGQAGGGGQTAREGRRGGPAGMSGPGGGPGGGMGGGGRPPAVALQAVEVAPVVTQVKAVGAARAKQSVTINAEVSGVIARVVMKSGAEVKAGAPLVALVDEAERIALAKARADYAIAETNAKRYAELLKQSAASQLEYESSRNAFAAARASLDKARYDFERRTIRAPFDGIVGLITLDAGDFLSVGATVTTIDDLSELLVDFVVPEQSSAYVKPGLQFKAATENGGGRIVDAVVRSVDSRIDVATRTRRIEAAIANPGRTLLPGATFAVDIALPSRDIASVPGLSVLYDRAGAYVWRRGADGSAERVPVTVVSRTADAVLVEGALSKGDLIVAEGADSVRPGAPLIDRRSGGGGSSGDSPAAALK